MFNSQIDCQPPCRHCGKGLYFNSRKINTDPEPWKGFSGVRYPPQEGQPNYAVWEPRPEFDNNPNPILVMFRRIDAARTCSPSADTATLVLEDLDGYQISYEGADDMDDAYDGAGFDHIAHARKVLERLAALCDAARLSSPKEEG